MLIYRKISARYISRTIYQSTSNNYTTAQNLGIKKIEELSLMLTKASFIFKCSVKIVVL